MPMKNIPSLIEALGGSAAVAKFLRRPQPTVCSWMARNSIPHPYWKRIVDLAHRHGMKRFRMEQLWELHT